MLGKDRCCSWGVVEERKFTEGITRLVRLQVQWALTLLKISVVINLRNL